MLGGHWSLSLINWSVRLVVRKSLHLAPWFSEVHISLCLHKAKKNQFYCQKGACKFAASDQSYMTVTSSMKCEWYYWKHRVSLGFKIIPRPIYVYKSFLFLRARHHSNLRSLHGKTICTGVLKIRKVAIAASQAHRRQFQLALLAFRIRRADSRKISKGLRKEGLLKGANEFFWASMPASNHSGRFKMPADLRSCRHQQYNQLKIHEMLMPLKLSRLTLTFLIHPLSVRDTTRYEPMADISRSKCCSKKHKLNKDELWEQSWRVQGLSSKGSLKGQEKLVFGSPQESRCLRLLSLQSVSAPALPAHTWAETQEKSGYLIIGPALWQFPNLSQLSFKKGGRSTWMQLKALESSWKQKRLQGCMIIHQSNRMNISKRVTIWGPLGQLLETGGQTHSRQPSCTSSESHTSRQAIQIQKGYRS